RGLPSATQTPPSGAAATRIRPADREGSTMRLRTASYDGSTAEIALPTTAHTVPPLRTSCAASAPSVTPPRARSDATSRAETDPVEEPTQIRPAASATAPGAPATGTVAS